MSLPKIDELFTLLKGVRYFTALHLCPKSAFTTVFGKFEFLRLPFGLSQSPDFFIQLIYDLFGLNKTSNQSQSSGCLAYLNDILIYTKTEKEQLEMLNNGFEHLSKAGLKIKLSKCSFV